MRKRCNLRIKNKCVIRRFTKREKGNVKGIINMYGKKFRSKSGAQPERFFKQAMVAWNDDNNRDSERHWLLYQKMIKRPITDSETKLLSRMTKKELNELAQFVR